MHSCNALALELNCALMNVAADRREKDMHALAERHGFRTPWQVSKSTPRTLLFMTRLLVGWNGFLPKRSEVLPISTTKAVGMGFFLLKTAQNLETSIS